MIGSTQKQTLTQIKMTSIEITIADLKKSLQSIKEHIDSVYDDLQDSNIVGIVRKQAEQKHDTLRIAEGHLEWAINTLKNLI